MERNIVSKGKTVAEAVNLALDLLGASKENVNIEILDNGSKGVFGLAAKPAVVRVTMAAAAVPVREVAAPLDLDQLVALTLDSEPGITDQVPRVPDREESVSRSNEEHKAGKLWVEGGVVYVKSTPERRPLIGPVKHAKIFKNGVPVETMEPLTDQDRVTVEVQMEHKEPEWELIASENLMSVTLHVKPGYRLHRSLRDMEPRHQAEFEFEEVKLPIEIQSAEVLNALKEKEITFGIKHDVIKEACRSTIPGSFLISEGMPAAPGSHGHFQTPIETGKQHTFPRKREDGTVDYREIREFPTASEGEILGTIIPPVPGVPGINVKGETVEAPPVYPVVSIEGIGVAWTDNGSRAIAMKAGMPQIRQQGYRIKVSIVPKLIHAGDVDLTSGNIHFQGDVEITGSVQDGMKVDTSGSILIFGNVNMSSISASQSLIVRNNIISSKITVGKSNMLYAEMEPLLKEISERLIVLKAAIHQISHAAAFKVTDFQSSGLRPLLNVLLKGKFKHLNETFVNLFEKIEGSRSYLDEEWIKYAGELHGKFLNPMNSKLLELNDLDQFQQQTDYLHAIVEPPLENHVFAKFDYAHNSHIYSGGDVVASKGFYGSMVYCQGELETRGFLRGGVYYGGKGIRVGEAGSGGKPTKLHVPEHSEIRVMKALEGTVLQIGKRSMQLSAEEHNIHARLNANGELILH
ncbi:FapA family protein [Saccharibacillus kuerlensis]|uniref:RNA-binding protein KhpB N-terminal domain-containing protein n=1 Tax=Saccharibacillus kuerlensis TaxID=459527 RepID=A0ABQ2L6E8_9BACL|nr:FapA family protein [Saccharibacillus kuerlensis]GGO01533.1 hypothetical protein GCM10010969_23950 [Saccharibacillus kuerlensis]